MLPFRNRVSTQYRLYIEYVRHLWLTDCREEALVRMESLSDVLDLLAQTGVVVDNGLRVSCLLELGDWKLSGAPLTTHIDERLQLEVLTSYKRATLVDHCGYRAWHAWALLNFRIAVQKTEGADAVSKASPQEVKRLKNHVVSAVQGFGNAISVGTKMDSASVQQDLLNFLSCLFQHGNLQDIASVTNECIASIALEAWLGVLPQLLARIHIREPAIRAVLHPLLTRLGEKHPQGKVFVFTNGKLILCLTPSSCHFPSAHVSAFGAVEKPCN
jgi:serine/threonine-protein kinase mTOR